MVWTDPMLIVDVGKLQQKKIYKKYQIHDSWIYVSCKTPENTVTWYYWIRNVASYYVTHSECFSSCPGLCRYHARTLVVKTTACVIPSKTPMPGTETSLMLVQLSQHVWWYYGLHTFLPIDKLHGINVQTLLKFIPWISAPKKWLLSYSIEYIYAVCQ